MGVLTTRYSLRRGSKAMFPCSSIEGYFDNLVQWRIWMETNEIEWKVSVEGSMEFSYIPH